MFFYASFWAVRVLLTARIFFTHPPVRRDVPLARARGVRDRAGACKGSNQAAPESEQAVPGGDLATLLCFNWLNGSAEISYCWFRGGLYGFSDQRGLFRECGCAGRTGKMRAAGGRAFL